MFQKAKLLYEYLRLSSFFMYETRFMLSVNEIYGAKYISIVYTEDINSKQKYCSIKEVKINRRKIKEPSAQFFFEFDNASMFNFRSNSKQLNFIKLLML